MDIDEMFNTDAAREVQAVGEQEKVERLCLDFDEDCVLGDIPPFGSYRRCWDYDRTTGFCPFCLPREGESA